MSASHICNLKTTNKFPQSIIETHVGERTVAAWNKWNKSDLSQWNIFYDWLFFFSYLDFVLLRIMTYYVAGGIKEIVYFRFHSVANRVFCSLSSWHTILIEKKFTMLVIQEKRNCSEVVNFRLLRKIVEYRKKVNFIWFFVL